MLPHPSADKMPRNKASTHLATKTESAAVDAAANELQEFSLMKQIKAANAN